MHPQHDPSPTAAELRRQAEARLREQHLEAGPAQTEADTQRLVHELQVHQIELEMQNETLQQARDEVELGLEMYSDLYDFAPVGYVTLEREGIIREVNLAGATLLGLARSRLLKRRFGLYVTPPDRPAFTLFLTQVFESKVRQCCELTLLREGGTPVQVRIEAAVAASGRECRAVLEDLTEHKRAEADRLILNKLESTGLLAGGLAHDFNNLLTVMLLNLEHAQELAPPGGALAQSLVEAQQSALTAQALTHQLISLTQGGAPVAKPTPLAKLLQESVPLALSGSPVQCEFSLAKDLWPAQVDEGQIGQVLRHLALNAREAMPEGGVVSVQAGNVVLGDHEVPALPPGDYVRVSIADRGVGIAPDMLPKIFDPYFSTKPRSTQKGMGLGLTTCHAIIQKHGGAIAVESEVGIGTTFHIHLPAARRLPAAELPARPKSRPLHGRILVMDDEHQVRQEVGVLLQDMGYAVELAPDAQRALEVYASAKDLGHPFDAVLLDLTIRAGVGGPEAVQTLLRIDPAARIIAMTRHADDPALLESARHGFRGILVKPFQSEELRQALGRVLSHEPNLIAGP